MLTFSVKGDVDAVMKSLTDLQRKQVPGAVSASLNRAAKQAHTDAVRKASRALGIKQSLIKSRIRFQKRDKASAKFWEAGVFSVIGDIPGAMFGKPRQLKKGAKAGKKAFPGAFVAKMPKGYTGIWKRTGQKRFPIKEQEVPIRDTVEPIVQNSVERVGMAAFEKRFEHELTYRLQRKGLL